MHICRAHCSAHCPAHCSAHVRCTLALRTASHFALPIALHICFAHLSCTFAPHIDLHTCFANLLCTFALDIRLAHSLCAFALRMTIPIRCSSNMNHNYGVEHSKVFTNTAKRFHESGAQQQALLGAPGHASERASALCLTHSRAPSVEGESGTTRSQEKIARPTDRSRDSLMCGSRPALILLAVGVRHSTSQKPVLSELW